MVACDHPDYRKTITALLRNTGRVEILEERAEGEDGVDHVRRLAPDVLILGVDPLENCPQHARLYRDGFDGAIVGFALQYRQHDEYRQGGIDRTIDGSASVQELRALVIEVAGIA